VDPRGEDVSLTHGCCFWEGHRCWYNDNSDWACPARELRPECSAEESACRAVDDCVAQIVGFEHGAEADLHHLPTTIGELQGLKLGHTDGILI
jgi:hypothetical protein